MSESVDHLHCTQLTCIADTLHKKDAEIRKLQTKFYASESAYRQKVEELEAVKAKLKEEIALSTYEYDTLSKRIVRWDAYKDKLLEEAKAEIKRMEHLLQVCPNCGEAPACYCHSDAYIAVKNMKEKAEKELEIAVKCLKKIYQGRLTGNIEFTITAGYAKEALNKIGRDR